MDALDGDMKDVQKFLEESYKVNVFDVFNENFHEYKLLWLYFRVESVYAKLLEVYCYAEKVPAASSYPCPHYFFAYAFDTSFIKNSILRVSAASIDSYKASEPWKHFGQIVALTEWWIFPSRCKLL